MGKGGASIYEQAAMNANPYSAPPQEGPVGGDPGGERIPCPDCGRKFNEAALVKHTRICKKVFVEKRKAFDMKDQRKAEGM